MKIGFRKPSLRKSIAARTSPKRIVKAKFGLKAPRGFGWLTNPKRAAYNRVYNRSSFGAGWLGMLAYLPALLIRSIFFVIGIAVIVAIFRTMFL